MESKQERRQSAGQTDGLAREVRKCPRMCSPINVASRVGSHAATVTANTTAGETRIA